MRSVLMIAITSAGCVVPVAPASPGRLLQPPYDRVRYVSAAEVGLEQIDTVEFVGRGAYATLLHTVPALYQRALELDEGPLLITNIQVSRYTRREPVVVSYQECRTEIYTDYVSEYRCTGGYGASGYSSTQSCSTTMTPQTKTRQKCETKTRTEMHSILYQRVRGDVLRSRP